MTAGFHASSPTSLGWRYSMSVAICNAVFETDEQYAYLDDVVSRRRERHIDNDGSSVVRRDELERTKPKSERHVSEPESRSASHARPPLAWSILALAAGRLRAHPSIHRPAPDEPLRVRHIPMPGRRGRRSAFRL